jgi:hypothetical protein
MGEVFLAEDTRLERRVAVKMLPASSEADTVARERLRRKALAAAALDHPFICKVFEIARPRRARGFRRRDPPAAVEGLRRAPCAPPWATSRPSSLLPAEAGAR